MRLTERIFVLKQCPPFDRLGDSEIAVVAEIAKMKRYKPGEVVSSAGSSLQKLFVVFEGSIHSVEGKAAPRVFGVPSLLFDLPVSEQLIASQESGATCLLIKKGHFFRILNEMPEFAAGFLEEGQCEQFYNSTSRVEVP